MSRAQRKIDIPNPFVFFLEKLFPIDHFQQLKRPFLVIESSLCTDNKKKKRQQQQTKNQKKTKQKKIIFFFLPGKKKNSLHSVYST